MFSVDRRPKPFCATLRAKRYAEPFACGIGLIRVFFGKKKPDKKQTNLVGPAVEFFFEFLKITSSQLKTRLPRLVRPQLPANQEGWLDGWVAVGGSGH